MLLGDVAKSNRDTIQRFESVSYLVCPFNEHDRCGIEEIIKSEHFELRDGIQTVSINVKEVQSALVLVDQHEGQAIHLVQRFGTSTRSDPLDELRFSAAQWTFHGEDFAALESAPYLAAQIKGLCG